MIWIQTLFDTVVHTPPTLLHRGAISHVLERLFPGFLLCNKEEEGELFSQLLQHMPLVRWIQWEEDPQNFSVYLLCKHQNNAVKFFYEMAGRWILPAQNVNISSFLSTDVRLNQEYCTLCEMVISVQESAELEHVSAQLRVFETELRLGLASAYHAHRILEIKGLSSEEKNISIQERVAELLKRYPSRLEPDILLQMQQFLVMCSEEFKTPRTFRHIGHIILVFYMFRKKLLQQIKTDVEHRVIHIKLFQTTLHLPLEQKKVLSVFVGMHVQNGMELFEERHFIRVLHIHFPALRVIERSFFSEHDKEEGIQLFYLEVEKGDGSCFAPLEIKGLQDKMRIEIRQGIETIAHSVFMPRNEEELMRNIITLANELKFLNDIPQAIVSFDGQRDDDICFTVVWVRIVKPHEHPFQRLLTAHSDCIYHLEKVKQVGWVRKKFPKEACVLHVKMPIAPFLRPDHSIDLFKARCFLVAHLEEMLGEFRDFNGGMLAKQHEQFLALKGDFPHLEKGEEWLLENFFHSLLPVERRTIFPVKPLSGLFALVLEELNAVPMHEVSEDKRCLKRIDAEYAYVLFPDVLPVMSERFASILEEVQDLNCRTLALHFSVYDRLFVGAILREADRNKKNAWLQRLHSAVEI